MLHFLGLLFIAPLFAQEKIQVRNFSPQGYVKSVEQVRIEFAQPMVQFGDLQLAAPAQSECFKKGQGRWLDTKNWVFDFTDALPGGLLCSVKVAGQTYQFNTGGPSVKDTFPRQYRAVETDQSFILMVDAAAKEDSIKDNVYFVIEGLGDKIPVEVIDGREKEKIVEAAKEEFKYDSEALVGETVVVKAKRTFPAGGRVSLVWGKGVQAQSGAASPKDETFEFEVAEAFKAEFSCQREAVGKPCIPLLDMSFQFNSSVALTEAQKIYLQASDGKKFPAQISPDEVKVSYLTFKGPFAANSSYVLHIPGKLKDEDGRALTNQNQFPLKVKTGVNPPLLKFAANFGVVEAGPEAALAVTLRRVEKSLINKFTGVTGKFDASKFKNIVKILNEVQRSPDSSVRSEILKTAKAQSIVIQKPLNPSETEVVGIPLKQNGFYFLEVQSPVLGTALLDEKKPYFVRTTALVSSMAVHLKYSENEAWVWVTKLKTAEVVPNSTVRIFDVNGSEVLKGTTNSQGLAYFRFKQPLKDWKRKDDAYYYDGFFAVAEKENDFSFAHSSWTQGIETWRYQLGYAESTDKYIAHGILDRTLFKPEETLSAKLVLRRSDRAQLQIPSSKEYPGTINISHDSGLQSFKQPLKWNEKNGTAVFSFQLPAGAKMGRWSLSLQKDKNESIPVGGFSVESFRVPLIQISLLSQKPLFVLDKSVPLEVTGKYFAGGPASDLKAKLRWSVEPSYFEPESDDYVEYSFANGVVKEGLFRTGEDESARYIVQSGTQELKLSDTGSAKVNLKDLKYGSSPQRLRSEIEYKDPNGEIQNVIRSFMMWPSSVVLGIKAKSWWTRPDNVEFGIVAMDLQQKPLAKQKVAVDLFTSRYYSHRKRLVGGFYAFEDFREFKKVGELCEGETDSKGVFNCVGKSKVAGSVIAVVRSKDKEGRDSYANVNHWIIKEGSPQWFGSDDHDRADLIPFKKSYEAGEVAEFQLRTPFAKSKVLVTIEREGVLHTQIVDVKGDKPVIKVPIKAEYAPNVVVSAFAIRERIDEPLPTALVDLGKPALKLGMAAIKVGTKDNTLSVQVQTDKKAYKVREKVSVTISVKDSLNKPATGEVAVVAVDEGLLELRDNQSWDLLTAMMKPRPHQVTTASGQTLVIGKRHFGLKALPIGGDGGGALRRELFDTLLYWNPQVKLDKNGQVQVVVPLNDSTTSFRFVAVALDGADKFGHGFTSIQSSQDIMIVPGLGGIARLGDVFKAGFAVRNNTAQIHSINLKLKVNGAETSYPAQKVDLKSGESKEIFWEIKVNTNRLEYVVSAVGTNGKTLDEVKKVQKVLPVYIPRVLQTQMGLWPEFTSLNIEEPAKAVTGQSSVLVELQNSIGLSKESQKDFWKNYPYTCLEQQVSKSVSLADKKLWQKIEDKLSTYIDANGLLRYFPNDQTMGSVALTSYILAISHEAGFKLSQENETRLLDGISAYAQGRTREEVKAVSLDEPLKKVSAFEVLSRYGKLKPDLLTSINEQLGQWPLYTLIEWYQIHLREKSIQNRGKKLNDITQQIRSRLIVTSKKVQIKNDKREAMAWLMRDSQSALLRLILAADLEQWKTDLPRLYTAALSEQKQGAWLLTTSNAWGVLANKRFQTAFAKEKVEGAVIVQLGSETKTHAWTEPMGTFELPLKEKKSNLVLAQKGPGAPWITVSMKAAVPISEKVFAGLQLEKTITAIEQKRPGSWSIGDVAQVKIKVKSATTHPWLVLEDPIPAGASVLTSSLASAVERMETGVRFYEEWFSGEQVYEYTLRFNQSGMYQLPATHAEVMYSPDIFADLPETTWTVSE
ncbi:alpha-2-macroglobulin family protein [Bdellovibrio reynosensis]|uniref:MG2 domain-containing protein n=1 Tax=Bdellovibrio reynosensis TaxID=2835041 RepID=A0ABY4CD55_9BACT|nr:MG2 domain-containing protein [Bdellovibrio reynosensis]UOF00130.1 MG2 domain-containing protein [Bdellovibrio reynosensis]